ncbi:MAG: M28 family peptidase [Candidatus Eisenbacteria bacterium]
MPLLLLLLALPLVTPAIGLADGTALSSDAPRAYELDRRSHPALTEAWDAARAGRWDDPRLSVLGLPAAAEVLRAERDRILVSLDPATAERLAGQGVRLRPERIAGEPVAPRAGPILPPFSERSLTFYESLSAAVSIDEMMSALAAISVDIPTRYYNTAGMQAASQYAYDRFVASGLDEVRFDDFTYNGASIRNVIGVKRGSLYPNRIYMVCGHLDSTSPQPQTQAPGAEDNGSGSIGVLEAARLLAPLQTDATIYFVCFTAEEQGLIGSEHLSSIADQENWDLRGVLDMDMVGYDIPGGSSLWIEGFPANPGSVSLMNLLESVAETYTDLVVYRYPYDGWGSDHEPFNAHGFPAVLAIDYDWDNYPCYHQTCDVIANIGPEQFRSMVVTNVVAAAQLANATSGFGSVEGTADRVDDPDDGGIEIEVAGTGYSPVATASDGSFSLADLLPGEYTIRASAEGYEPAEAPVTVVEGQAVVVHLPLEPLVAAAVHGTVMLAGGGAAAGARVFVTDGSAETFAGAAGDYDLSPVYPGRVVVNANYDGRMPGVRVLDMPNGQDLFDIDFDLETIWTFEENDDGLTANSGWEWGTDGVTGAHSGTKVWGTKLSTNYGNCADYRLDLPPLDLREYQTARLHFWHWYKTEAAYDGGNVQVSTDDGASWAVLSPVGGYPSSLSGSCNPLAGQPGYSGTRTSWTEAIVDLSAWAGQPIRVRFWFGSDEGTRDRGWYIDDLSFEGTLRPADVADGSLPGAAPRGLTDLRVSPNPLGQSARVLFRTAAAGPAALEVFDAAGRRIRRIESAGPLPAGAQWLTWQADDDEGRNVPAGIYWLRVHAGGRSEARAAVVLR